MQPMLEERFHTELVDRRGRLIEAVSREPEARDYRALLVEVDAALARMQAGTYGLCETCRDPIEADRLSVDPLLRRCIDHLNAGERRQLEQDLELASRIQAGLLPPRELTAQGWEIAHHFEPYGHVGGDYCDVVRLEPPGCGVYFLLGDVSGKGVAASLLMTNLHATIRSLSIAGLSSEELLTRANRLFCQNTLDTHYATLVCGRSTVPGVIELASAGHWPVAHVSGGRTCFLDSTGLALGMFCGSEYRHRQVQLDPGDFLVFYTDGLTEARNGSDEEYGIERLAAHLGELGRRPGLSAHALTTACVRDLAAFRGSAPASDDLTIMVVRRPA